MLEKIAQKNVLVSIAEGLTSSVPTEPTQKLGVEKLKSFTLFAFEVIKEVSDFTKPKSKRKALLFEALDLIPFISEIENLKDTFKQVIADVRDLDEQEVKEIALFVSNKVPNLSKISAVQQKQLIQNIIIASFAVYEVASDIIELSK